MKKLILLTLLVFGTGAAYSYNQAKLLMGYGLKYVGYKKIKLSFTRIIFELSFQIKNKSAIDITVTSFDFNIYLNGIYATRITSTKQQIIKANSFSIIKLLIDIEPQKNKEFAKWNFLQKALSDIGGIKVKTSGVISLKALGVSVKNQQVSVEMPLRDMLPDKNKPSQNLGTQLI